LFKTIAVKCFCIKCCPLNSFCRHAEAEQRAIEMFNTQGGWTEVRKDRWLVSYDILCMQIVATSCREYFKVY